MRRTWALVAVWLLAATGCGSSGGPTSSATSTTAHKSTTTAERTTTTAATTTTTSLPTQDEIEAALLTTNDVGGSWEPSEDTFPPPQEGQSPCPTGSAPLKNEPHGQASVGFERAGGPNFGQALLVAPDADGHFDDFARVLQACAGKRWTAEDGTALSYAQAKVADLGDQAVAYQKSGVGPDRSQEFTIDTILVRNGNVIEYYEAWNLEMIRTDGILEFPDVMAPGELDQLVRTGDAKVEQQIG